MNPVVHFEIPADNMSRMREFYETAFGWKTNQLGEDMGEYVVVMTAESDEDDPMGRPKMPGSINGGFYKKTDDPLMQYPSIVIEVEDIKKAMTRVEAAGGEVIGGMRSKDEPDDIPGVGLYASILDTEGNRVGILEPKSM